MIIKELNLIGFGKFKHKEIHLKNGINIIYGENEDGKTTIHNFINGMFYGFLKPYVKRTIYLDEYNRYEPWDNSKYSGIIKFSLDDENYSIEREFTKNNESTKVIIDETGEDITNSIDTGDGGRILQPGNHFFGFNHGVYANTISIKQLESKTEELLANEVRDRLINISNTLDDELSVQKAMDNLGKTLKDIGTTRAPTSLYGSIYERLNVEKLERQDVLNHRQQYRSVLLEKEVLEGKLYVKFKELQALKDYQDEAEIFHIKKIYAEAVNLEKDIKIAKDRIKAYEKYKDLDNGEYLDAINVNNNLENLKDKELKYKENLEKTIGKRRLLKSEFNSNPKEEEIVEKYIEYDKLEDEKEILSKKVEDNHLEFLKKDFEDNKRIKDKYKSTLGIVGFVVLISILGTIFLDNFLFVGINFISIPLGIFSFLRFQKSKKIVNLLKEQILQSQEKENHIKKSLKVIEKKQKELLNYLGLSSKSEFKNLEQKIQFQIYTRVEKQKNIEILNNEIAEFENDILSLKTEIQVVETQLSKLLKKNLSLNIQGMEQGLKYKKIYEDSILDLKNKEEMLNRVLNGENIENFKKQIFSYDKQISIIDDYKDIKDIKIDIDIKKEEISTIKIQKSAIEEKLNYLNNKIQKLVEIEESIDKKEKQLSKLDKKKESIELAMHTIDNLSKGIHKEFAPKMNKTIGDIVGKITGGKYINVKINDKLEIRVVKPETGEMIPLSSLSGGTIDQLYFSLRFGILNSFDKKTLPLILDDCFIQYDDTRLENMMKLLIELSRDRQIILFTCHKREFQVLDKFKIDFNLIELS